MENSRKKEIIIYLTKLIKLKEYKKIKSRLTKEYFIYKYKPVYEVVDSKRIYSQELLDQIDARLTLKKYNKAVLTYIKHNSCYKDNVMQLEVCTSIARIITYIENFYNSCLDDIILDQSIFKFIDMLKKVIPLNKVSKDEYTILDKDLEVSKENYIFIETYKQYLLSSLSNYKVYSL